MVYSAAASASQAPRHQYFMAFLSMIENSAFCTWVREGSSIFGYYGFLFLHTVGLALLVGFSIVIDLRLLGVARSIPLDPLDRFFPVMWTGFWINAVSGAVLLAADATTKFRSPLFGVKMCLIALATAALIRIRRLVFRGNGIPSVSPGARALAAASVVLWLGAIAAGRLMAYIGAVSGLPGVTNRIGG